MRKLLVLLVVLVATSCTIHDVDTVVGMGGVHPILYFDEPMPEMIFSARTPGLERGLSTTREPTATVCVRYERTPGVFTVDVFVKNKTNDFETIIHLVNFDATEAEAKACAAESIPLELGVNVIRARAVNGGKAVVRITRELEE